jgi:hypothetical protein
MEFTIKPADTFIWNLSELVDFLIAHQNQAIIIKNGTEGCCAETVGLYQWLDKFNFTNVIIETSNVLERHPVYTVKLVIPWKFVTVQQLVESKYHIWNKKSIFGTLYGRPLWHRLGLAAHLLAHHKDVSDVGMLVDPTDPDQRKLFELTQLWQHSPNSTIDFANIQKQLPVVHPNIREYTPGATLTDGFVAQSKQVYINFLIDIVAETFTSGNCLFVTEKTVRPMLLKKPFIIFGSRDFLAYLRQMGFRTFGDFWDESYDGYAGAERYTRIIELINQLAKKSSDELETMYLDMQYTLDHNYNLLINQRYNTTITYLG